MIKFKCGVRPLFCGRNPARIFVQVPSWPGPFDVEIDCVAIGD